jgi:excisionase family DNA binding protein
LTNASVEGKHPVATPLQRADEGLTIKEAADRIGVSKQTIHNWIDDPRDPLPVTRFGPSGRIVRIHPDDLQAMIRTSGGP